MRCLPDNDHSDHSLSGPNGSKWCKFLAMVVESPWNPPKSLHKSPGIGEECGSKELASDYQHLFKFIIIGDEASREESKKLEKGVPIGSSPWVPYQKSLGVWETETGGFSSSTTTISIISACRGGACLFPGSRQDLFAAAVHRQEATRQSGGFFGSRPPKFLKFCRTKHNRRYGFSMGQDCRDTETPSSLIEHLLDDLIPGIISMCLTMINHG